MIMQQRLSFIQYITLMIMCRKCFVNNDDVLSLSTFCKTASIVHPDIRRSKIADTLWSQFIFEMAEEFCHQPCYPKKTMVTCMGRQPKSAVWVFNDKVHIDIQGCLIEKDQQKYFW